MDHGAEFGPTPGLADLPKALSRLKAADGILPNPAMLEHTQGFSGRNIFRRRTRPRSSRLWSRLRMAREGMAMRERVTFENLCKFMTLLHEVTGNPEGEFPRIQP